MAVAGVVLSGLLSSGAGAIPPVSGPQMAGMDVSVYQGNIDFQAVRRGGAEVVYIRAGYGAEGVDAYLKQHYEGASAAGLKVGFYYYMDAESEAAAREQAAHFAELVKDLPADCRPVMDFETFGEMDREEASRAAAAFLEETESRLGQQPMVYTDASAAGHMFDGSVAAWPLWVADYGAEEPAVEANWEAWTGWQYTDQGQVPGIQGRVDLDHFTSGILLREEEKGPREETSDCYTVRRGDTLWGLARQFHTTVGWLVRRNHIADPSLIYPGQVLRIPPQEEKTVTVQRGDTLWGIARRFQTTVGALAEENHIANPDLIYPGEVLRLPE